MKKDNKGLTLIEMIVTVAIIAIFAGIVMSFVTSSSNEFRSTSSNAKIQMQTQETLNQIQELLIDANRGIQYKVDGVETESDFSDSSSLGGNKELSVMSVFEDDNEVQIHTLVWNGTDSELVYAYEEKKIESIDSNNKIIFKAGTQKQIENGKVLLQNIKDFQVDLSQVEQEKNVRFKLSVEEKGKKITTEHVVNLRNKISVMDIDGAVIKGKDGNGKIRISSPDDGALYNVGSSFSAGWMPAADSTADIRLSSIKWSAVSPDGGVQFTLTQSRDIANIKINGGSGSLRITVTAEDAFGNPTEDIISINVIGMFELEGLKLEGLNLVGAGNVYQLEDCWQVSGTMTNGKEIRNATAEELGELKWFADGKEISKVLEVGADRGAAGDSQIRLGVKCGNIESTISVAIARVDIINLNLVVTNTNSKQVYCASYLAGGIRQEINGLSSNVGDYPVTWTLNNNSTQSEELKEQFDKDGNGTWTICVKVNLGGLSGVISDQKTFEVNITGGEYEIVGDEWVTAEEKYLISSYWRVRDKESGNIIHPADNNIQWSIESSYPSKSVSVEAPWEASASIVVDSKAEHFVLRAKIPAYAGGVGNKESIELSYNIKVVKLIGISTDKLEAKIGDTIGFRPQITIGGSYVTESDRQKFGYAWSLNHKSQSWNTYGKWMLDYNDSIRENKIMLSMTMSDNRKIYCPNTKENDSKTESTIVKNVSKVEFQLYEINRRTSVIEGESLSFWCSLSVDGVNQNSNKNFAVQWDSPINSNGILGKDGVQQILCDKSGKTTVQVYVTVFGEVYSSNWEVSVTELSVNIQNKHTISRLYPNDVLLLKAMVYNGEDIIDKEYKWKYSWVSSSTCDIRFNEQTGEVIAPNDVQKVCTFQAVAYLIDDPSVYDYVNIQIATKDMKSYPPYYISENERLELGIEAGDVTEEIEGISTIVYYTDGRPPENINVEEIPGLDISYGQLPIKILSGKGSVFAEISKVDIVVELLRSVYHYTIIPKLFNVYVLNGKDYVLNGTYVPEANMALEDAVLIDAYTYRWNEDNDIRRSIRRTTGLGLLQWGKTSMNQWFMKQNGMYFKNIGDKWYEQKSESIIYSWKDYWNKKFYWFNFT